MPDFDSEDLWDLVRGTRTKFGLAAQGHLQVIEMMLSNGHTWNEIGVVIGWCPETAERWYYIERFGKAVYEKTLDKAENVEVRGLNPEIESHDPYIRGYRSGVAAKEEAIAKLKEQS